MNNHSMRSGRKIKSCYFKQKNILKLVLNRNSYVDPEFGANTPHHLDTITSAVLHKLYKGKDYRQGVINLLITKLYYPVMS